MKTEDVLFWCDATLVATIGCMILRWVYQMTFCKYCKAIKQELGIKALTEDQAKRIMCLYLNKTAVETAIEKMKEK